MYSIYFKKRLSKAKPSFDILRFDIRYSAVRVSLVLRFAVQPRPGHRSGRFDYWSQFAAFGFLNSDT